MGKGRGEGQGEAEREREREREREGGRGGGGEGEGDGEGEGEVSIPTRLAIDGFARQHPTSPPRQHGVGEVAVASDASASDAFDPTPTLTPEPRVVYTRAGKGVGEGGRKEMAEATTVSTGVDNDSTKGDSDGAELRFQARSTSQTEKSSQTLNLQILGRIATC
jgi:hypothetical protein